MDKLTALDAGFLHAEDADQHTNLGIGGLAVLDGPMPDYESLTAALGERIAVCPRFAQRLRRRVLDVSAPEWVDDGNFDLNHHVRRIAVPAPGADESLFGLVADVMSWRLDRDRPLWEIWVIEGLADNRWAMLIKVHPCIADGVATMHILTGLCDNAVVPASAESHCPAVHPVPEPEPLGWREILPDPVATWRTMRGLYEFAVQLLRPVSSLIGPATSRRRYSAARVAMADVRKICRVFDVTVEDVALAALTESYRDMLLRRREGTRPDALRLLMPTSTHPVLPCLPVDEDSPVLRLRKVHARLSERHAADRPPGAVAVAARLVPFPLSAWTLNLLARLPQHSVSALAVQVPGPHQPLQLLGRAVTGVLPIPPIALRVRTGVAILQYGEELFFGILADYAVPDVAELARGVETAVARLLSRSRRRRAIRERHGLSLIVNA